MATKYIFVTGGVVSSLGKGITAASLGRLLKTRGLKVALQKFDPYINVDPGLMSPYQHGEVFVTEGGKETDLDLGHYERFIDVNLANSSSVTAGQIYWMVINKERQGDYKGGTVQVIPHVTNQIKREVFNVSREMESEPDVVITEIGGTVGDIEGQPFLEAIRQIRTEMGAENCLYIHVTLVPYIRASGELKTKPTQHSVKELRSIGIQPDIIVCRSEAPLDDELKRKIGLFCNVQPDCVVQNLDAETLYEIPLLLHKEGLDDIVCRKLKLDCGEADIREWSELVDRHKNLHKKVTVALVGRYIKLRDAYLSDAEALVHGGIANDAEVDIRWVAAQDITPDTVESILGDCQGVLLPSDFSSHGAEGKLLAAEYARKNGLAFLGIGMGMHMALAGYGENVVGIPGIQSAQVDPDTTSPIAKLSREDADPQDKSLFRLGAEPVKLIPGTRIYEAYGAEDIKERHRCKYELDEETIGRLKGVVISGRQPEKGFIEAVELENHPWFVGVQYEPQFLSRPNRAHPLFREFIAAALKK